MDAFLESYGRFNGEAARFSGYVLVTKNGKPIYEKATCCLDHAKTAKPDQHTNVRLGSISKQFAATAIMLLAQDGKLAVTDTIGKHLPKYPKVGRDLTIHQLLTHTSGIPSYTAMPEVFDLRAKPLTPAALLKTFWDKPLEFAPGSKFSYSNSGYAVLAAIVEAVSKKPYAEFALERMFRPAGHVRTVVGDAAGLPNRADGFTVNDDGALVPAKAIDMSVPLGAGDVRSTAHELMTWFEYVTSGKLITADTWKRMTTVEKDQYAYGWIVAPLDGKVLITHGGGIDGFSTAFWAIPEDQLMIFAWSNNDTFATEPIAKMAYKAYSGKKVELAKETKPADVPPATLARYQGAYELTAASREAAIKLGVPAEVMDSVNTMHLKVVGKFLRCEPKDQGTFFLTPTSDTEFVFERAGITATFAADGGAFTMLQGGLSLAYQRKP